MRNFPTLSIFCGWEREPRGSHILTKRAGHQTQGVTWSLEAVWAPSSHTPRPFHSSWTHKQRDTQLCGDGSPPCRTITSCTWNGVQTGSKLSLQDWERDVKLHPRAPPLKAGCILASGCHEMPCPGYRTHPLVGSQNWRWPLFPAD